MKSKNIEVPTIPQGPEDAVAGVPMALHAVVGTARWPGVLWNIQVWGFPGQQNNLASRTLCALEDGLGFGET